ncbi:MAG: PilZ domain-containing protein, partial [Gemmatimonadota bacterium]|nr:PilZ domain-containing protein [Gemmatimonadota bacterium]
ESHALRDIDQRSPGFLLLSHTEEIQRVQSRQFYRLETSIPFKFKRFSWDKNLEKRYLPASEELTGDIDGVIGTISAGGLMFSTGEKLTRRDMLLFDLQINSEISIQDLSGKVVGFTEGDTEKENGLNRVHLNFLNIKSGEQDLILHMIQQHRLREEA